MEMTTYHMNGAGNRFVVIDGRQVVDQHVLYDQVQPFVPELCNRSRISMPMAEGVLVLAAAGKSGFDCIFFNPDGSSGMMCGNGSRCIVRFAAENSSYVAELDVIPFTLNGVSYHARVNSAGLITITFAPPVSEFPVHINPPFSDPGAVYYVNINSDHLVVFDQPYLSDEDIRFLRHYPEFHRGCNVNIVHAINSNNVELSTFERGVEDITQACGTGAISTAIACWRLGRTGPDVTIIPPSKQPLYISIIHKNNEIQELHLSGPAEYDGSAVEFDPLLRGYIIK